MRQIVKTKTAGFTQPSIKTAGFTLMELMITVAIIGILAAIVMPSYTQYVIKTKRTDAKVGLLKVAQMQESYFVQNMSYAKTPAQLGFPANQPIPTENNEYSIAIATTPSNCTGDNSTNKPCKTYKLVAQPVSGGMQNKDTHCGNFSITNTGQKKVSADSGSVARSAECWK